MSAGITAHTTTVVIHAVIPAPVTCMLNVVTVKNILMHVTLGLPAVNTRSGTTQRAKRAAELLPRRGGGGAEKPKYKT